LSGPVGASAQVATPTANRSVATGRDRMRMRTAGNDVVLKRDCVGVLPNVCFGGLEGRGYSAGVDGELSTADALDHQNAKYVVVSRL
jgi:hypothetical protein